MVLKTEAEDGMDGGQLEYVWGAGDFRPNKGLQWNMA